MLADKTQKISRWLTPLIWALAAIELSLALNAMLRVPSEAGSAVWLGLSAVRLTAAGAALAGILLFSGLVLLAALRPPFWQSLSRRLTAWLAAPKRYYAAATLLFTLISLLVAFLFLARSPAAVEAVILRFILERIGLLLVCAVIILLQTALLLWLHRPAEKVFTPLRAAVWFALFTLIYSLAILAFNHLQWDTRLRGTEDYIFYPAALLLVWAVVDRFFNDRAWYSRLKQIFLLAAILLVTFTVYRQTSQHVAWVFTPNKTYWHMLADAFLHGRLYLINPDTTHDLTFFNNQWYVPNPPLPAFIVMPFVALIGVYKINMVVFSIWVGAVNVVLTYLLLAAASQRGLTGTGLRGNLWLTALFAFGTVNWWLAVMGRMWFLSQTLTVTFLLLAALLAVRGRSPWWVGAALGAAMLSRPNVFTIWPLLVGIFLYFDRQTHDNRLSFKRFLLWSIQSAIPVVLAVAGLLYYNFIRFGDLFDFGYVSIHSAEWLMNNVQTYGMFNAHFFPINFKMMFLTTPALALKEGCLVFAASRDGYSLWFMTPAIIYIFRRFKANPWVLGAWVSVLLSVGLLLLYHNTGAWQLGYRYLMDFFVPVLLLIALGVKERPSGVLGGLIGLSILSNLIGVLWWFNMWAC